MKLRFFIPCVGMASLLWLPMVLIAGSPTPATTPPVYEMTQAQYDATVKHRNELAAARTAKEAAQKGQLEATGKAEDANTKLVPELQDNIKLLNSDLATEKRHSAWNLWKGGLIAFPLGIIAAIVGYFLTKGTVLAAKIAAIA